MILYSSPNCPKCQILKTLLKQNNISYQESNDYEDLEKQGIMVLPVLKTGENEYLDFEQAVNYITK